MKKTLKWMFISPILFFGIWLIALFCERFRTTFVNTIERLLKTLEEHIERSL